MLTQAAQQKLHLVGVARKSTLVKRDLGMNDVSDIAVLDMGCAVLVEKYNLFQLIFTLKSNPSM